MSDCKCSRRDLVHLSFHQTSSNFWLFLCKITVIEERQNRNTLNWKSMLMLDMGAIVLTTWVDLWPHPKKQKMHTLYLLCPFFISQIDWEKVSSLWSVLLVSTRKVEDFSMDITFLVFCLNKHLVFLIRPLLNVEAFLFDKFCGVVQPFHHNSNADMKLSLFLSSRMGSEITGVIPSLMRGRSFSEITYWTRLTNPTVMRMSKFLCFLDV